MKVFTRHRASCPHRAKPHYDRCYCPKYAHWSVEGRLHKRTLKTDDLDTALRKIAEMEKELTTAGTVTADAVPVDAAVAAYLDDKRSQHLAESTILKLRQIFEKSFAIFCRAQKITRLSEITLSVLQRWRSEWKDSSLAASKKQERVKGFFYFCVRMGWLRSNPAVGLSRIKVTQTPTSWFKPDEFDRIITAASDEQASEKLTALINVMRWGGLAIRDAVTLERSRLDDDDTLLLHRAKTGVLVSVTLPPDVAAALRALPVANPRYFFWSGNGLPKSAVADYQRALRRVFKRAGVKGHPHMLRNTFSVSLLMAGVALHDVALLLGHSSVKTTEKHYAPFVLQRRENLLDAVRAAWTEKIAPDAEEV